MSFRIQILGTQRRGDGKARAQPFPPKERRVRWACLAIFFLALGLVMIFLATGDAWNLHPGEPLLPGGTHPPSGENPLPPREKKNRGKKPGEKNPVGSNLVLLSCTTSFFPFCSRIRRCWVFAHHQKFGPKQWSSSNILSGPQLGTRHQAKDSTTLGSWRHPVPSTSPVRSSRRIVLRQKSKLFGVGSEEAKGLEEALVRVKRGVNPRHNSWNVAKKRFLSVKAVVKGQWPSWNGIWRAEAAQAQEEPRIQPATNRIRSVL